mgnify:CR=1 FL=1
MKSRGVEVLAVSVDSQFTHAAWRNTPVEKGGIGPVRYTMIADVSHEITKAYDVEHADAHVAYRGTFLIDKSGLVRHQVVNDLPPHRRCRMGLARTYQIITLFAGATLEHNVALSLLGLNAARWNMFAALAGYGHLYEEARGVLARVGLEHLAARRLSEVSYGEKRRVEIAMALAQNPKVLLLDEPFAHVDAYNWLNLEWGLTGLALDPAFATNWVGARAAGLVPGGYHFYTFCRTPEEQAENFRKLVLAFGKDVVVLKGQTTPKPSDMVVTDLLTLRGYGTTDLAGALYVAGSQLARSRAGRKVTVLLSDCRSTVDGDPVAAAAGRGRSTTASTPSARVPCQAAIAVQPRASASASAPPRSSGRDSLCARGSSGPTCRKYQERCKFITL